MSGGQGTDGVTVAGPVGPDKRKGPVWDADTPAHPLSCVFLARLGGAWDTGRALFGIRKAQLPARPGNFWHIGPPGS